MQRSLVVNRGASHLSLVEKFHVAYITSNYTRNHK